MAIHFYYIALIFIFAALGYFSGFLFSFIFYWVSLSFLIISVAYLIEKPGIFRKNTDGRIPLIINVLLWPFILGVYVYNAVARKLDKTDKMHQVDDGLFVGTRLNMHDFTSAEISGIDAIVDMTAEFSALDWGAAALDLDYLNSPTLDHQTPKITPLKDTITWIDNHISSGKNVVVHCALGRGRSVFVAAAYLLAKYPELSVEQALNKITEVRTQAGLNKRQLKRLKEYHEHYQIGFHPSAWLIVNPAAGAGKWQHHKRMVINQLYKLYKLTIKETSTGVTAQYLTQQALSEKATTIIACGGDGTLREVAQELVNKPIRFGFLPMGTANALAHNLYGHFSKISPVELALTHLSSKQTTYIDTATCNGKTALLLAGVGLEYEMIHYADRKIKDDMGQLAYLSGFWRAYANGATYALNVSFDDGHNEKIDTTSFVVANAAPFTSILAQGNGSPDFQDGYLDVTWIKANNNASDKLIGLGELISSSLSLNDDNSGLATHAENIHSKRVQKVTIKSDSAINYVIDGELFNSDKLTIEINPNSLNVFLKQ